MRIINDPPHPLRRCFRQPVDIDSRAAGKNPQSSVIAASEPQSPEIYSGTAVTYFEGRTVTLTADINLSDTEPLRRYRNGHG